MFSSSGFYVDITIDGTLDTNIIYGTKNENYWVSPNGSMPMIAMAWASNTELPISINTSNQTPTYLYTI